MKTIEEILKEMPENVWILTPKRHRIFFITAIEKYISEINFKKVETNAKLRWTVAELVETLMYAKRFLPKENVDMDFINETIKKATE